MTPQEMYIIDQHTKALKDNAQVMNRLINVITEIRSSNFLDIIENAASTNMSASKGMQEAADQLVAVAKVYVEIAENNKTAVSAMLENVKNIKQDAQK